MDSTFPTEVLELIVRCSLQNSKRSPTPLLQTCSTIHSVTSRLLYTNLHFRSTSQLHAFLATASIPHSPRTLALDLDTDLSTRAFWHIGELFMRYREQRRAEFDEQGRIVLDLLRLGLDMHVRDEGLGMIEHTLGLVSPYKFVWTRPTDIPHHFSIAIVPPAVPHLFRALSNFTQLRELVLTHVAFVSVPSPAVPIPTIPSLEKLHIGQATFVDPGWLADALLANLKPRSLHGNNLREVDLVDVYKESIWGPRFRRSDLEAAAVASIRASISPSSPGGQGLGLDTDDTEFRTQEVIDFIRKVVVCRAETERRYGGDRVLEAASELI